MARVVSFLVLVATLVGIAILFIHVMWGFLLPLFLAALFAVVFRPLYDRILARSQGYRYVASGLTTLIVLILVFVPGGLVLTMAGLQGLNLVARLEVSTVPEKLAALRKDYGLEIPEAGDLQRMHAVLTGWRDQLRRGDTPEYTPARVDNLLQRVGTLEQYLSEHQDAHGKKELMRLREQLNWLRSFPPETVAGDNALIATDNAFRSFKRVFLGGAYWAFVKDLVNPTDEQLQALRESLIGRAGSPLVALGGGTLSVVGQMLFGVVVMIASLFFFLAEGSKMINAIVRLSPLEERYLRELIDEFERISRAVVAATLLAAVAQGVLAGIGFYFAGMQESVALLMILTMFLAMVPFAGAAAVWLPVCLYLYFYEGRTVAALILGVYGAGIVSTVDNFIKPLVLHGQSNLHPLLALLSVLGGLTTLGPIGIMVGPMAVVFLQTLLKILQREMLSLDKMSRLPLAEWATYARANSPEADALRDEAEEELEAEEKATEAAAEQADQKPSTESPAIKVRGNGARQPTPPAKKKKHRR